MKIDWTKLKIYVRRGSRWQQEQQMTYSDHLEEEGEEEEKTNKLPFGIKLD